MATGATSSELRAPGNQPANKPEKPTFSNPNPLHTESSTPSNSPAKKAQQPGNNPQKAELDIKIVN